MRTKKRKQFNQTTRAAVLLGIAFFVVLIFTGKLLYLQIFSGDRYRKEALNQRRTAIEIAPKRGNIYDRNKTALAMSVTVNTCYLFPERVEDRKRTTEVLSHILGLEISTIEEAMDSDRYSVRLKTRLSESEVNQLKTSDLRCYSIEQESGRFYPKGDLLSQTLGFVNDEGRGVYGLEASYDSRLAGEAGLRIDSRDLGGQIIPTESGQTIEPKAGDNLLLTIDSTYQEIVHTALKSAFKQFRPDVMTAILIDPNTGEILAMSNLPSFDSNKPYAPTSDAERARWSNMSESSRLDRLYEVWKNQGVSNLYEPGSVFKALTAAISVETRSSKPSSRYLCTGSIDIAEDTPIFCIRSNDPHGEQTLKEALANSCNPAFVQIAREIGPAPFFSYLRSLHIGSTSGVDLPAEATGSFPGTLDQLTPERMATMSYGHGVSVTPLQMISAANATINGGYYYTPHIVRQITDEQDRVIQTTNTEASVRVFSGETSRIMREYLLNTVREGVSTAVDIEGVKIGGKSGTTTKLVNGQYTSSHTVSSFWSFYPADRPRLALIVVADNPKTAHMGNEVAGECSRAIWSKVIAEDSARGIATTSQNRVVSVPKVTGLTVAEAEETLRSAGLKLSVYGDMNRFMVIDSQSPAAEGVTQENSTVEVRPATPPGLRIPDLTGKSKEEIEALLKGSGLKLRFNGSGVCASQSPASTEVLRTGAEVVFQMKEPEKTESNGE